MSSHLNLVELPPRPRRGRLWLRVGLIGTALACLAGLASSAAYKVREAGTRSA